MIVPCLTYLDMRSAMTELADTYALEIVGRGDDAAEIRWRGVAVAQVDCPEDLLGSHVGNGWTYVRADDPDALYNVAQTEGALILNEPHATSDRRRRRRPCVADARATSGPSSRTGSPIVRRADMRVSPSASRRGRAADTRQR